MYLVRTKIQIAAPTFQIFTPIILPGIRNMSVRVFATDAYRQNPLAMTLTFCSSQASERLVCVLAYRLQVVMFQPLSDILEPLTSCNGRSTSTIDQRVTLMLDGDASSNVASTGNDSGSLPRSPTSTVITHMKPPPLPFPFDLGVHTFRGAMLEELGICGQSAESWCTTAILAPHNWSASSFAFSFGLAFALARLHAGTARLFQHTINLSFEKTTSAAETVHCISTLPHRNQ